MIANARVNNGSCFGKWNEGSAIRCEALARNLIHSLSPLGLTGPLCDLSGSLPKDTISGEPGGIRTHNLVLKRHLLCH